MEEGDSGVLEGAVGEVEATPGGRDARLERLLGESLERSGRDLRVVVEEEERLARARRAPALQPPEKLRLSPSSSTTARSDQARSSSGVSSGESFVDEHGSSSRPSFGPREDCSDRRHCSVSPRWP